jgi:hypothetical protein
VQVTCPSNLHLTNLLTHALIHSLTQWSRFILEKLIVSQLANKSPAYFETWTVVACFRTARHLSLSWAKLIHVLSFYLLKIRFSIILPSVRSSFASSLLFEFLNRTPVWNSLLFLISTRPTHLILLYLTVRGTHHDARHCAISSTLPLLPSP